MQESYPYRRKLYQFAEAFRERKAHQAWREDSLSKAEEMLFVGFLFVRKLIECKKVTDSCARSSTKVLRAAIKRAREVSDFKRDDLFKDLGNAVWSDTKVDVHQLADKVIHAWWILPIQSESRGLDGFIFTTDRQRNTELWWLQVDAVVEIYDRFATQVISGLRASRDETGRLTYWQAY